MGTSEHGDPQGSADAGWYRDNLNPARERYWNGRSWTAHTRPSQAPPDPLDPATAAPLEGGGGIDSLQPPEGDRAAGWYPDKLVPNRLRFWDGNAWTTLTRAQQKPPKKTAKSWLAGWAIALIGLAALAGGLAVGFLAAFDESQPDFRSDARASAISEAKDRYGVTETKTETETVIRTTPAPNGGP